jgi:hypothetical protein
MCDRKHLLPQGSPVTEPHTTETTTAAGCPRGCPEDECYCPDGSEPRWCGHGPGGTCDLGHCYDCGACWCGED